MRNLYAFIDRPEYSQHFNWADPFYEDPPPTFTFIGAALAPLNPVSRQISSKFRGPIICRHSGLRLGSCSIEIKFISSSSGSSSTASPAPEETVTPTAAPTKANGKANGAAGAKKATNGKSVASRLNGAVKHSPAPSVASIPVTASELSPGNKLGLQIIVGDVKGLSKEQFESVHLQIRMSSIAGPSLLSTDTFTSSPVDMASETALAEIKLKRTASFVLTEQTIDYLRSNSLPIEFHAVVRPAFLKRIEDFDSAAELGDASLANGGSQSSRKRFGQRSMADADALLEKALIFWKRSVADAKLDLKSSDEAAEAPVAAQPVAVQPKSSVPKEPTKLSAEVTLVPRTDIAAKRGWLGMPIEVFTDQWTRRWFVLRRPYLYVYESSSEMDEVMVISLRSVRVENDANIERMLERDNVFGLYTSSNSYFLQAPNEQEKELWMRALDNRPRTAA